MQRQITACGFSLAVNNGAVEVFFQGYNTAANTLKPKEVSLHTGTFGWEPYYFAGTAYDQSLSGRYRSQLGGYRLEGSLVWSRLLNTTNLLEIVNKTPTGKELTAFTLQTSGSFTLKTNIVVNYVPFNDAYNGMKVQIGAFTRNITDSYSANSTIIVDAATTIGSGQPVTVTTRSNMRPILRFYPNVDVITTNYEVVLDGVSWDASVDRTIVNNPIAITFKGAEVSNTIPTFFTF